MYVKTIIWENISGFLTMVACYITLAILSQVMLGKKKKKTPYVAN